MTADQACPEPNLATGAGQTRVTRARCEALPATTVQRSGVPDAEEQQRLAETLGTLLREARLAAELTQRSVSRGTGCSTGTPSKLEAGKVRPRASLLHDIAEVIRPADVDGFTAQLVSAAGESLVPDDERSIRHRRRRRRDARVELLEYLKAVKAARTAWRESMETTPALTKRLARAPAGSAEETKVLDDMQAARRERRACEIAERYYLEAVRVWPRPAPSQTAFLRAQSTPQTP